MLTSPSINNPTIWQQQFPWPKAEDNKYDRGSLLVLGGQREMTGASKLAATSALRIGCGLATIACDTITLPLYTNTPLAVMTRCYDSPQTLHHFFSDKKYTTLLLGPGAGVTDHTRQAALAALATGKPIVLDADALTVFASEPHLLVKHIKGPAVLTPHEGEFKRLFPLSHDRQQSVLEAASQCQAVIILKGSHTLIASPQGQLVINDCAPPTLATAGSGDVLAGLCAGLLANNITPFTAACMAVWIHSQAANLRGPGLIADDLVETVPDVLKQLRQSNL